MNQGLCFVHDSTRSPFIEWVLPKCYTPPKKHAKLQNTWNIMKLWKHQKSHSSTKRGACLRRPERTWVPRTNFMYQDVPNPKPWYKSFEQQNATPVAKQLQATRNMKQIHQPLYGLIVLYPSHSTPTSLYIYTWNPFDHCFTNPR